MFPQAVFLRTMMRLIDNLPPTWIVPFVNAKAQRLGDIVAGTVVISVASVAS